MLHVQITMFYFCLLLNKEQQLDDVVLFLGEVRNNNKSHINSTIALWGRWL